MKVQKQLIVSAVCCVMALSLLAVAGCGNDDKSADNASASGAASTAQKDDSTMSGGAATAEDQDGVMVGGAMMVRSKDIVDNAVEADNVTTLVSLVKQADLVDTLKSRGPFTVFAPTNDAFGKLDPATVKSLQEPKNKKQLAAILTYHVVPGSHSAADLKKMAEQNKTLKTVQGERLTPVVEDGELVIKDASGNRVNIETPDVISSNGVTHVVTSVLMPKG